MILLDLDSMGGRISFKRSFGSQCLHSLGGLLEVHIRQAAEVVHKDGSNLVALAKEEFFVLSYVYLQESTKGVQTLAAKRSFEAYSASHGVQVQQYHADDGRFAEKLFLNH